MGASTNTVSAYGGLNFYSSEVMGKSYSFSAGNSQIAMALTKGIEKAGKDRIRTSSYVYRIKQKSNGNIIVYYFQNGEARAVEAETVIASTPYFVTSRIIDGLSDGQRGALGAPKYGSYITANLRFNKSIPVSSFSVAVAGERAFTDYASTGWPEKNRNSGNKGEIITCYAPYEKPVMGRCRMIFDSKEQIAMRIVKAFEKILPGSVKHLEEVYLTRWGHALIINEPYMYTKWLPSIEKNIGSIYLCHSDGQGLPALEYSLMEAFRTVKEIDS
jgi:protoporphyrinogen oxidase